MKKLCFILITLSLMVSLGIGHADPQFDVTLDDPSLPRTRGRIARQVGEFSLGSFPVYELEGEITDAHIFGKWGGRVRGHIYLYVDGTPLIDLQDLYRGLNRRERRSLRGSNRALSINLTDFTDLDGDDKLMIVGAPRSFRGLRLGDITLSITDRPFTSSDFTLTYEMTSTGLSGDYFTTNSETNSDVSVNDITGHGNDLIPGIDESNTATHSTPEPATLLLLGSGLAGAGLYRRFRKQKK